MGLLQRILELGAGLVEAQREAAKLETALDRLQQKMEVFVMSTKTGQALLGEMNTATTAMAARFQALLDQVGPDQTAAELAIVKTGMQTEIDRLNGMGTGGVVDPTAATT